MKPFLKISYIFFLGDSKNLLARCSGVASGTVWVPRDLLATTPTPFSTKCALQTIVSCALIESVELGPIFE